MPRLSSSEFLAVVAPRFAHDLAVTDYLALVEVYAEGEDEVEAALAAFREALERAVAPQRGQQQPKRRRKKR